jgi:ABC-type Fe3+ transport system permease subunit
MWSSAWSMPTRPAHEPNVDWTPNPDTQSGARRSGCRPVSTVLVIAGICSVASIAVGCARLWAMRKKRQDENQTVDRQYSLEIASNWLIIYVGGVILMAAISGWIRWSDSNGQYDTVNVSWLTWAALGVGVVLGLGLVLLKSAEARSNGSGSDRY